MANVYVEARPKGREEGAHIDDYVVEDHADTCWRRSFDSTKPSRGRRKRGTTLSLLVCGM